MPVCLPTICAASAWFASAQVIASEIAATKSCGCGPGVGRYGSTRPGTMSKAHALDQTAQQRA